MATVKCIVCRKDFEVRGARVETAKFCSYACRGKWRSENWIGENHPRFQSGPRVLNCQHCGEDFSQRGTEAISEFRKRKFCSMECAKHGQKRLEGEAHPLYRASSRRNDRRGKHGSWARAVISRDMATCQHCGAKDTVLHAHHIKPFREYPELRWELTNGITLCFHCHLAVHSASTANRVNSGNIPPGNAEDNPEPSFERKLIEGVTTSGRVYRRWEGKCEHCGSFVSKPWSRVTQAAHVFCGFECFKVWSKGRPKRPRQ